MKTTDRILVRAPLDRVFDVASNVFLNSSDCLELALNACVMFLGIANNFFA